MNRRRVLSNLPLKMTHATLMCLRLYTGAAPFCLFIRSPRWCTCVFFARVSILSACLCLLVVCVCVAVCQFVYIDLCTANKRLHKGLGTVFLFVQSCDSCLSSPRA